MSVAGVEEENTAIMHQSFETPDPMGPRIAGT